MAQMIFNEKETLFGEFGPELTKVEKQEKWMEILVKLNSVGANLTDYKVLRDNEWSNQRRATEKKVATLKANGTKPEEERVQCKPLSQLDEIVLDILGKGNGTTRKATINLDEPSLGSLMKYEEGEEEDEASLEAVVEDTLAASSANTIPLAKRRKRSRHFAAQYPLTANYELMELRRKKLHLECAKLELELEKIPLECAKLELEIQTLQRNLLQQQPSSTSSKDQPDTDPNTIQN